jgi:predicted nucleotidyltransferase component of viral defense system
MEYKMKLHGDKKLFRQAVEFTAQQMNIPAVYVEKDYWVTYTLHTIFNNPIGKETIFKGGTSLSKCFGLTERFSEDIDLVVIRRDGESNNQLTNKLKKISNVVSGVLPEVQIKEVTRKMGMNRKTAHTYTKEFDEDYGQIRDVIIVESSWLGYFEPHTTKNASSFIYEMMQNNKQQSLAEENGLLPFEVLVLEPKRTLCEKIMSLVRFSYTENAMEDLNKKVRHTYDLYQLLKEKELLDFFQSKEFDEMLLKVANDDVVSYKSNNQWLKHHPNKSKLFAELETVWKELKGTYNSDFKNLVFGVLPNDEKIYKSLVLIKNRLSAIEWTVIIDE